LAEEATVPYEDHVTSEEVEQAVKNLLRVYDRLPDCTRTEQAKHLLQVSQEAAHQAVESRGRDPEKAMGLG
jgi:hypothetical protein